MTKLKALDQSVFWWINEHHSTALDWILWCFSQSWCWLSVITIVFIFITLRKDRKNWLWVLAGLALCFLLADQISNNAFKDGIQRLRPCYELEGVRMFHTNKGGLYGFVSSHAANAFAVAVFLSLLYGHRIKSLPYLIIIWAVIVGYSRPYLGKHYPGDVICGALLGIGIGAMVYFVISKIKSKTASKDSA
ncbi:MAG: phosphatase PAP2 family protein [Bacteroidales bacterium]|nr:phosphatase PAP2 family protein [Bacteroidales bacterium]